MIRRLTIVLLLATMTGSTAFAAGPPDPDWPCIQRRQPAISVGQVWPGPAPDAQAQAHVADADVQHVSRLIALRRTTDDQARALIADFAASHDAPSLVGLFLATFEHVQQHRNKVMAGITRYAHQQAVLDQQIKEKRHEFTRMNAATPPDFDAIDKVEAQIDWSTRIFQDRQQSLIYVCETPVILEQRAFALGRMIAAHLPH